MRCHQCKKSLVEITLQDALNHTRKRFLKQFSGSTSFKIFDPHTQYVLRSYLKNHSLFLFFDLNLNQMKYGREIKRFFIQPVNMLAVFNIPWFIFNLFYSNYFHFTFKSFCPQCNCKHGRRHTKEQCDYNIAYFHILRDILNGDIIQTKKIYEKCLDSKNSEIGTRKAYLDLSRRNKKTEIFFDLLSVTFSVFLWIFVVVFISFPMFKVLLQKLYHYDAYQWSLF